METDSNWLFYFCNRLF